MKRCLFIACGKVPLGENRKLWPEEAQAFLSSEHSSGNVSDVIRRSIYLETISLDAVYLKLFFFVVKIS